MAKLSVLWLLLCVVLYVRGIDREDKYQSPSVYGTLGYGLELILKKFDIVSSKLKTIEDKIQAVEDKFTNVQNEVQSLKHNLASMNDNMDHKFQSVNNSLRSVHNITRQIMKTLPKHPPFSSCKNVPSTVSGKYLISVNNDSAPFQVYCEQEAHGGGWIVFQYRYDGSLDFYRGWDEFRDGFGDLNKEFWLGLEKVHQITSGRKHELIVELKDFSRNDKYARYDAFEIGSESDQYVVKELGKYSGTAGDAMYQHGYKDRKFSTKDRDNDWWKTGNCAQGYEGAWWYGACTNANLNGRYKNAVDKKSMHWWVFKNSYNYHPMSYSRMMIRELE